MNQRKQISFNFDESPPAPLDNMVELGGVAELGLDDFKEVQQLIQSEPGTKNEPQTVSDLVYDLRVTMNVLRKVAQYRKTTGKPYQLMLDHSNRLKGCIRFIRDNFGAGLDEDE
jgi:hypothetical protein